MLGIAQEIVAPADGVVGASLVEAGDAVEYGQELILIEFASPGAAGAAGASGGSAASNGASTNGASANGAGTNGAGTNGASPAQGTEA